MSTLQQHDLHDVHRRFFFFLSTNNVDDNRKPVEEKKRTSRTKHSDYTPRLILKIFIISSVKKNQIKCEVRNEKIKAKEQKYPTVKGTFSSIHRLDYSYFFFLLLFSIT
ncbi:unnamed protein product [Adineta ricciae]|uniref:Uncharacterized protein n=1 Tax=Adineta ricciae TaxID=249248 RepID=A0A814K5I7_ADIRI|nr:unnamed protein product [Adineta ricciae]